MEEEMKENRGSRSRLSLELVKQCELLPDSTIDILCLIKQTGHIAVTGLTHPCISVFKMS